MQDGSCVPKGWENLPDQVDFMRSINYRYESVDAAFRQKTFGFLTSGAVTILLQNICNSNFSLLSHISRLVLCFALGKHHLVWLLSSWNALGKIISSALHLNHIAHLPDFFHLLLLLFCHIKHYITVLIFTFKIPSLLSPPLKQCWLLL